MVLKYGPHHDDAMQISLEDVQNEADPYRFFLDSLKAKDTYRKYKSSLEHFLVAIPTSVFEEISENAFRPDFVLYYKPDAKDSQENPIAVIENKKVADNAVAAGIQQAIDYAMMIASGGDRAG
ncbi:MAG: hypothetical protein ACREBI_05140 [Nitrosotalea sp.]